MQQRADHNRCRLHLVPEIGAFHHRTLKYKLQLRVLQSEVAQWPHRQQQQMDYAWEQLLVW
jgi:hypothetical protein